MRRRSVQGGSAAPFGGEKRRLRGEVSSSANSSNTFRDDDRHRERKIIEKQDINGRVATMRVAKAYTGLFRSCRVFFPEGMGRVCAS